MGARIVQFYEDDTFLIKGLVDFVGSALRAGDTAIAIATGEHLARLGKALHSLGKLDADRTATQGQYLRVEADMALLRTQPR